MSNEHDEFNDILSNIEKRARNMTISLLFDTWEQQINEYLSNKYKQNKDQHYTKHQK